MKTEGNRLSQISSNQMTLLEIITFRVCRADAVLEVGEPGIQRLQAGVRDLLQRGNFQRRCEHAIVGLQMPRRCGCCTCPPAPGYVHTFNAPVETSLCEFPADPKPHRSRSIIRASHLKLGNLKPPSTAAKYIDVLCHKRTSKYTRNNLKYILPQHHIL